MIPPWARRPASGSTGRSPLRRPGEGVAGFLASGTTDKQGNIGLASTTQGFLTGAAGVGLALLDGRDPRRAVLGSRAPGLDPLSGGPRGVSSTEAGWRPILEEGLAERALDCAEEIAADLRRMAASTAGAEPLPLNRARFSLAGGLAGQALFFAYLDRARPGQGYDDSAIELLEEAFDELGRTDATPGLCSGFAGVAWTVEHLRGWLLDLDGEDSGAEVAAALARLLDASSLALGYDLVSGLVGLGVYALERLPRPLGRPRLERVVARLADRAERGPQGVAWWTPPDRMTQQTLKEAPDGLYDLGSLMAVPA